MRDLLARSWWVLALQGAVALLFGILAMVWPGLTLLWLVALFAAYAIISGALELYAAVSNRTYDSGWWLLLVLALVSIASGVLAWVYPGLTALVLVLLMGANALATGVLEIVAAIRLRKAVNNEWLMVLAGVVSVLFGIFVFVSPGAGALALVWLIAFWAIVHGVLWLSLAIRVRGWRHGGAGGLAAHH
jgi:uncharacterized membrane protein HdeD (DUF308 family)